MAVKWKPLMESGQQKDFLLLMDTVDSLDAYGVHFLLPSF
jgi:hypothetical protein